MQAQLAKNAVTRRTRSNAREPSLLTGLIEKGDGARLRPSHTNKRGQRYRYYVTKSDGSESHRPWRLPAPALERAIVDGICGFLADRQRLSAELAPDVSANMLESLFTRAAALSTEMRTSAPASQREILLHILRRATIAQDRITVILHAVNLQERVGLDNSGPNEDITIQIPISVRRRGVETRLIVESAPVAAKPDQKLIELVVRAHRWFDDIRTRPAVALHELAKRDRADPGDISRILSLAFLAPDIVQAILDGRQPPELTAARLKRMQSLPIDWQQQRRQLGFE